MHWLRNSRLKPFQILKLTAAVQFQCVDQALGSDTHNELLFT